MDPHYILSSCILSLAGKCLAVINIIKIGGFILVINQGLCYISVEYAV
jgi:DNA-directed RNA polymerase subunit E'/Rpb7